MDIIQNTPVTLNLSELGLSTGWTFKGNTAVHESCNAGDLVLQFVTAVVGHSYLITYNVDFISGGNVRVHIGSVSGKTVTSTGFVTDTIIAASADQIALFSNANCGVSNFSVKDTFVPPVAEKTTVAWSEENNKWASKRDYRPEGGFSLFNDLYFAKDGQLWKHDKTLVPRNKFFGVQYNSSIKFVANKERGLSKTFSSLTYEANQLLVTTKDGITTSLGQVSELSQDDFIRDILDDGVNRIVIYEDEGVYSSEFLRDKNTDINEGGVLKGTYATIELVNVTPGKLRLKNVVVNSSVSYTGSR